ncbi:MAG: acyltransferase [Alphaproteobacteria bacterium]
MNSGERTYTGMRGVGALIVAFYHFRLEIPDQVAFNATTLNIFTELHVFLDMFFLVSGVVIFTVYSNLFEKGTSRSAIKKYLMARLARIYPLHIFALLLVLLLQVSRPLAGALGLIDTDATIFDGAAYSVGAFLSNLFMLQSLGLHDTLTWNAPSWTISVEMVAYLAFIVMFAVPKQFRIAYQIVIVAISMGILAWVMPGHPVGSLDLSYDYGLFRCLAGFMIGGLIYEVARRDIWESPVPMNIAQAVGFVLFVCMLLFSWYDLVVYPILALLMWGLRSESGPIGRLVKGRLCYWLGEISYSIYMLHFIVILYMLSLKQLEISWLAPLFAPENVWIKIAVMFAITISASAVTFRWVEEPARKWFKNLG